VQCLPENSSRDVQIAFANELSLICDKAGINVWELITLANKHPRVNYPAAGSGVGGHCICCRSLFLSRPISQWNRKIIGNARENKQLQSFWCAEKTQNAIKAFEVKEQREPVVALKGLAFKTQYR
jgi:UDP-N-acetyl-D-mannosaminuronic acid dehydrogenase